MALSAPWPSLLHGAPPCPFILEHHTYPGNPAKTMPGTATRRLIGPPMGALHRSANGLQARQEVAGPALLQPNAPRCDDRHHQHVTM